MGSEKVLGQKRSTPKRCSIKQVLSFKFWSEKIGVQKISLVPQEKCWGPEEILSLKIWGSETNLDKTNLGSNKFFGSKKAHIDLITALSFIEV